MQDPFERWRFSFDDDEVSLPDLTWSRAMQVYRDTESGDLEAQSEGESVSLEFDSGRAGVLWRGRDRVILRPYFPKRPANEQDLEPFLCGGCGIRLGDKGEYLSRFLLTRTEGFRLFEAVLAGSSLPTELPDPYPEQPMFPEFEGWAAEFLALRALEWRPLRSNSKHTH